MMAEMHYIYMCVYIYPFILFPTGRVTRDDEIDIKYLEGLFRSLFSPDQFERGMKVYKGMVYDKKNSDKEEKREHMIMIIKKAVRMLHLQKSIR